MLLGPFRGPFEGPCNRSIGAGKSSPFARAIAAATTSQGNTPFALFDSGLGITAPPALGPELVSNGDFSDGLTGFTDASDPGGSISVIDGQLHLINATGNVRFDIDGLTFEAGAAYRLAFHVVGPNVPEAYDNDANALSGEKVGDNELYFIAGSGSLTRLVREFGAGTTSIIDNLSLRKVLTDRARPSQPFGLFDETQLKLAANYGGRSGSAFIDYGNATGAIPYTATANGRAAQAGEQVTRLSNGVGEWNVTSAEASEGESYGAFTSRVVASNGSDWHRLDDSASRSVTSGTAYFVWVIFSAGTSGRARVTLRDTNGSVETRISGVIGALGASATDAGTLADISEVEIASGIFQVSAVFTPNFTGSYLRLGFGPDSNTSGENVELIAAQLTETDYDPGIILGDLTSANIQRAPISYQLSAATTAALNSLSEYTVLIEAVGDKISSSKGYVWEHGVDSSNRVLIALRTGGVFVLVRNGGSSTVNFTGGTVTEGTPVKIAVRVKENDVAVGIGGVVVHTDTVATLPSFSSAEAAFGQTVSSAQELLGSLFDGRIYGSALTDAELVEITS